MASTTSLQQALILSHEYRVLIVESLKASPTGEISPVRVAKPNGLKSSDVNYHVKQLVKGGVVEPTRVDTQGGCIEHFYRLRPDLRDSLPADAALDALAELLLECQGNPDGERVRAIVRDTGRRVSADEPTASDEPAIPTPAATWGMALSPEKLRQMQRVPLERRCACEGSVADSEGNCLSCSKPKLMSEAVSA